MGRIEIPYAIGLGVAAGVTGFLLGFFVATIILLRVPSLYKKLTAVLCKRTSSEALTVTMDTRRPDSTAIGFSHYSEIDERRTQTMQRDASTAEETAVKRSNYEEYNINKHTYSQLKRREKAETGAAYDALGTCIDKESPKPCTIVTVSSPLYNILDPETQKRLLVRPVMSELPEAREGHVYFKLEPGSDKVVPVPVSDVKEDLKNVTDRNSEAHSYFVLEPQASALQADERATYVRHANAEEQKYFILEKTT